MEPKDMSGLNTFFLKQYGQHLKVGDFTLKVRFLATAVAGEW